eukprot:Rhum_TRINITY_DN14641_c8_g1::Rhum_TRINITY_DN14641_c8_g1_i1::g.103168::m.103168
MTLTVREPTEEERKIIVEGASEGIVELNGEKYRVDYSVSQESRVTSDASFKKRTEKLTVSAGPEAEVIYFEVVETAEGNSEKKASLPDPLVKEPKSRRPCTFFNKGTCKNGLECQFSHNYVAPRKPRA